MLDADGLLALCWGSAPGGWGEWTNFVRSLDGAVAYGSITGVSPAGVAPDQVRKADAGHVSRIMATALPGTAWKAGRSAPDDHIYRAALAIMSDADVDAVHAYVSAGVLIPEVLALLDSRKPGAEGLQAFATANPWLLRTAATLFPERAREAAASDDPDDVAAAVVGMLVRGDAAKAQAQRIARAMRGQSRLLVPTPGSLTLLSRIPDEALGGDPHSCQALHQACLLASVLAFVSGREGEEVLGPVGSAPGYLAALARLGGREGSGEPAGRANAALLDIPDMVAAFHAEVVAPARAAAGLPRADAPDPEEGVDVFHLASPGYAVATRILLGRRDLGGLLQVSGRWRDLRDDIARDVTARMDGLAAKAPEICRELDLGDGFHLTSLTTPGELLAEGATGPDTAGVPGLGNFAGTCAKSVALGYTHVLSLRRRLPDGGYGRLSTAEVHLVEGVDVIRHHARGDAVPDEALETLLAKGLGMLPAEGLRAARSYAPPDGAWPGPEGLAARQGGWEALRDMWAFALPERLVGSGPGDLLAYGLEPS